MLMLFTTILSVLNFLLILYLAYLLIIKYRSSSSSSLPSFPQSAIEKVNLIRFNPFDDLGGDQSFILVLLDSQNTGVIITSLHHRNFTRIYAKTIKEGQGENITLSKEEKSAILKTINR